MKSLRCGSDIVLLCRWVTQCGLDETCSGERGVFQARGDVLREVALLKLLARIFIHLISSTDIKC